MRNRIAAILVAALMVVGGLGAALADSQKGGQGSSSGGTSGSGTGSGSGGGGSSSSNGPFQPISVQGWDGGAYRNKDGSVYCELSDDYGNGVSLYVGWDKYGFYLVIIDPNVLKMEPWSDFETEVSIDKIYRGKVPAYSYDADELELDFAEDTKGINALRKGERLTLIEWDHWYTLYGTGAAIGAVQDCYSRYR